MAHSRSFFVPLALAGAVFLAPGRTEAALAYADGDLFLGFRASGGIGATADLLIDIGQASLYGAGKSKFTLNLGNLGADLIATFGADWNTRLDLSWSVSGGNLPTDAANTLYATRAEPGVGTPATPWKGRSNSAQGTTLSKFNALRLAYTGGTATANSIRATIQNTSDVNSYASYLPGGTTANSGGIAFGAFNPTIEATFTNGSGGSVLDLFKIAPVFDQTSTLQGSFTISDLGAVSFTGAVPEPGALSLFLVGGTLLGVVRPRRGARSL